VHVDPGRVKTRGQREGELPAGGDIAGQSLLSEHPVHGGARKCLGGKQHVAVGVPGGETVDEGAGTATQILLDDDVHGRPELAGQLDRVAASDLQVTRGVDARSRGIDVRQLRSDGAHGRQRYAAAATAVQQPRTDPQGQLRSAGATQ
jgi:hypothetical protein